MPTTTTKCVVVIPARMGSRRFPGKPLYPINGKAMVHCVYDIAVEAGVGDVVIATADKEIFEFCASHNLNAIKTDENCPTGTHRVAQAVEFMGDFIEGVDLVINIQADEPYLDPKHVRHLVSFYEEQHDVYWYDRNIDNTYGYDVYTIAAVHSCVGDLNSMNTTKVAVSHDRAFWFSRAPMAGANFHAGIYAYPTVILEELGGMDPTNLSKAEGLEQLAWLEAGYTIGVLGIDKLPLSVNTPRDLERGRYEQGKRDDGDGGEIGY